MVDRYNIYYAYVPTKLNQRIHTAAISQVILAPILCMFWLLFFSVLRLGTLPPSFLPRSSVSYHHYIMSVTVIFSLTITGPVHPITLFTLVSLLASIAFSLLRLCLRKHPRKSTSYQVSSASSLSYKVQLNVT